MEIVINRQLFFFLEPGACTGLHTLHKVEGPGALRGPGALGGYKTLNSNLEAPKVKGLSNPSRAPQTLQRSFKFS